MDLTRNVQPSKALLSARFEAKSQHLDNKRKLLARYIIVIAADLHDFTLASSHKVSLTQVIESLFQV